VCVCISNPFLEEYSTSGWGNRKVDKDTTISGYSGADARYSFLFLVEMHLADFQDMMLFLLRSRSLRPRVDILWMAICCLSIIPYYYAALVIDIIISFVFP
jgi:hypothetical protein